MTLLVVARDRGRLDARSRRPAPSRATPAPRRPPPSGRWCRSCPTTPRPRRVQGRRRSRYLTGDYREEYDKLFDGIIAQNAPATGTVLKADLVRSGIVRSGEDRVQVFALVNQTRTNKKFTEPQIYKNWVTITMEKVDGDWLVAVLGHLSDRPAPRRPGRLTCAPRAFMIVANAARDG